MVPTNLKKSGNQVGISKKSLKSKSVLRNMQHPGRLCEIWIKLRFVTFGSPKIGQETDCFEPNFSG